MRHDEGIQRTRGLPGASTGTRERILKLLATEALTIQALSDKLEISRNAVRSQVALLRNEGLVEPQGEVKGSRRPAALYRIAPDLDRLFSQAYPLVLAQLVRVLARDTEPRRLRGLMKATGREIAAALPRFAGSPRERMEGALRFLESIGSFAELREEEGALVLCGQGCVIGAAVQADEACCATMEALLGAITGLKVVERCSHGQWPSCRFVVEPA